MLEQTTEVITTLIKAGADINARDTEYDKTALLWAAKGQFTPKVITLLLKAGLDAKAKDKMGYTALDYAKYNERLRGTEALKQLEEASKQLRRRTTPEGVVTRQSLREKIHRRAGRECQIQSSRQS